MATDNPSKAQSKQTEIIIAVLGLVGMLATGILSNWDKLFSHTVTAQYSGYQPTGNFEIEVRYYMEVAGVRKQIEAMKVVFAEARRKRFIEKYPDQINEANNRYEEDIKEQIPFDKFVSVVVPIYQKYFTVKEIQELNKFYSTEVMQAIIAKGPIVMQESMPAVMKAFEE